ncbi:GNAT family N-acetyltransferase [Marinomonas colpomeniae]|uniref:N-acetyltransferase n=1 Tax=Marinomonas colpomeniae TaxID=2774408 RepID=A0ABR8NXM8_9GAMM|nr:GNAT family N-acetyltransferase [Marinomonas colpomeniae]MBD5770653.1 N-acetyltransferase [Marinomonas colpomeniae]
MKAQWFNSVDQIGEAKWQAAIGETRYPFAQFAFHKALEQSDSIGDGTGWYSEYLFVIDDDDEPLAIAPTYLKTHSQGEFVFDWSWADAYQQHGLQYYPKRIWAIPFSPATGPRIFSHLDPQGDDVAFSHLYPALAELMTQANQERGFSSWHLLFTKAEHAELFLNGKGLENDSLPNKNLLHRISCQFHWFNRDYQNMEDYFSHFSSRKRKAARKEREKVIAQGVTLDRKLGSELTSEEIDFFYMCYQSTYAKRGQRGYLTREFFGLLADTMGEQILLVQAYKDGEPIAASWCFFDDHSLFGRYWGCMEEVDCLHFEACYYQGIEFCLEKGLQNFDPGTQGEHKIARGFEPVFSHSIHHIAHDGFREAIGRFCEEEAEAVRGYHQDTRALLPFKQSPSKQDN